MIELCQVSKIYKQSRKDHFTAVDTFNLTVKSGITLGIAGNSGCGKSTLARLMAGLIKPTEGKIIYTDIQLQEIQIIFQHPESALNPKMTILLSLREPIRIQKKLSLLEGEDQMKKIMGLLSLSESLLERYPHEISGGEAQRICICRALLMEPKVLILDEATSMLDVSTQASILSVLKDIRKKMDITMIMISHDLELLTHQCDEILLMAEGRLIEGGLDSTLGQEMELSFKYFYN